jgi:hypothetical protein
MTEFHFEEGERSELALFTRPESYRLISATDFILHNLSCLISAVVGLFLSFFLSSRAKCCADSRLLQHTRASEEGKNSIDENLLPSYLYTIHSKDIGSAPTCVPQYQISVQKESLRESARERVSETKCARKSQTLCETEREKESLHRERARERERERERERILAYLFHKLR